MPESETDIPKDDVEARSRTLCVVDFLNTQVQAVQLELIGVKDAHVTRLGTVLVYLPFLAIGYLLLLASVMKLAALALGWAPTAALFGSIHVAVGAWGMARGRSIGTAQQYNVLDPAIDPHPGPAERDAVSATRPSLPRPYLVSAGIRPAGGLLQTSRSLPGGTR